MRVATLTGTDLEAALPELARLRIAVFREWPYLYDGDLDYEERYLERFAANGEATLIGAYDDDRLVGASSAAPLEGEMAEFRAPFETAGYDIPRIFYFGESVLLPDWRGKGLGHAFFDGREARARELGYRIATFCAVVRPAGHPMRPADYRPLDAFWRKRGYAPVEGLVTQFGWKDIGETAETDKPMQFWLREL